MPRIKSNFLFPLSRKKPPNKLHCVYDIETLPSLDKVFLVGFYDGTYYKYFESPPMRPEQDGSAVDQFMKWILGRHEYYNCWIWAHNGGSFDSLYITSWLSKHPRIESVELIPIQSSILSLTIPAGSISGKKKLHFLDSYRLMSASLDKLGQAFGLGGKVEGIDYNTLHTDSRRYEYLERDCRLLHGCIYKFKNMIEEAGGEIAITAPSTAMKSFRRSFLYQPIPRHQHFESCKEPTFCKGWGKKPSKSCLHDFVREAYYGGRVEVFREKFDGPGLLNVGDFNSMYPAAMMEEMPVELSRMCRKLDEKTFVNLSKHWCGFIECTVDIPESVHIPPLPHRMDGKLVFPTGRFRGVWSSVELLCALEVGGKLSDWGQFAWFNGKYIFQDFVKHWYAYRDKKAPNYSPAMDHTAKLMLNSLYGKTGMNTERQKMWLHPSDEDQKEHPMAPLMHCEQGVWLEDVQVDASYIIPQLAAWVTSLSRVKLWRTMKGFLDAGHDVYYCDTDSVFTTSPIESSGRLGDLKLESQASAAVFAAPKMYSLKLADGMDKVKMKGFSPGFGGKALTSESFEAVMRGEGLSINRQTKMREGMRQSIEWPAMKKVIKKMVSKDTKRVHLTNGLTKAIHLG